MFLGPQYNRARLCYLGITLALYVVLVAPGPSVLSMLEIPQTKFPPETWALIVALVLVGFMPNANSKWVTFIEENLQRFVHGMYFVPTGVERAIAIMKLGWHAFTRTYFLMRVPH
jgi:hypothetical protein